MTVIIAAALSGTSSSAQWEWGLRGGAGAGRINTEVEMIGSRIIYQVVDPRPAYALSGWAAAALPGRLVFFSGIYWSSVGGYNELWINDRRYQATEHRYHFVSLPLGVAVDLGSFRIGGGYRFGVPLGGSATFTQFTSAYDPGSPDKTSSTNTPPLEWVDLGCTAELLYRGPGRFDLGLSWYRGFVDIRDHVDGFMDPLYPEQLLLTVGYRLGPKERTVVSGTPPLEPVD